MNLMNRLGSVLGSCDPICPILVVNSHGYNPVNPVMGQPITLKLLAIHHWGPSLELLSWFTTTIPSIIVDASNQ